MYYNINRCDCCNAEKMEPPVFVVKPINKDVKEEGKATFECKLKGKPLPEVTWSFVHTLLLPALIITVV